MQSRGTDREPSTEATENRVGGGENPARTLGSLHDICGSVSEPRLIILTCQILILDLGVARRRSRP
jgi:hypothetical protein